MDINEKNSILKEYLASLKKAAIAFSGGVDSTFLLKTAYEVLGENVIAITIKSKSFPEREIDEAVKFCSKEGIKQIIVEFNEFEVDGFADNPQNRCYLCKTALFVKMKEALQKTDIEIIAEGSNTDDNGDYRPGLIAVKEQGIKSPLRYAQLCKEDIRVLSRQLGLETWDKPSCACLASRFVYGEKINENKLRMVEKAEQFLIDKGFKQVRVRIHGENLARIEIEQSDFNKILEICDDVYSNLKKIGFSYVSLDLKGYRSGSMNEVINKEYL